MQVKQYQYSVQNSENSYLTFEIEVNIPDTHHNGKIGIAFSKDQNPFNQSKPLFNQLENIKFTGRDINCTFKFYKAYTSQNSLHHLQINMHEEKAKNQ